MQYSGLDGSRYKNKSSRETQNADGKMDGVGDCTARGKFVVEWTLKTVQL